MKQADLQETRQSTRDELRVEDYYLVEGIVINFKGNLQMFHIEHQMIIHQGYLDTLSDDEKKELVEEQKISYLYEGFIGLIDRSSQHTGKLFHVQLFSNERRAQFFDPALIADLVLKAESDFTRSLERAVKALIQAKLQTLVLKSSFSNTVSMRLEPIKTDTLIFRLTNTTFD